MQLTANRAWTYVAMVATRIARPAGRERWANGISIALSPPVAGAAALLGVAARIDTPDAWAWSLADIALVVALPLLFVVWLVQTGRVSGIDLQLRQERVWPYRISILSAMVAAGASFAFGAPHALTVLLSALAVQGMILSAVTAVWKVSLHTAAVAGAAVVAWHVAGPASLGIAALVPVVAWARITLGRHTPAQTIAGALVGSLICAAAFVFIPVA